VPKYLEEFTRRVEETFQLTDEEIAIPVVYTTAQLTDITSAINISILKVAGYQVFDTTLGQPLWAAGDLAGDVWVDATGATVHTPV